MALGQLSDSIMECDWRWHLASLHGFPAGKTTTCRIDGGIRG